MVREEKITPDNGGEITISIGDFTNRLLIEMKGVQLEEREKKQNQLNFQSPPCLGGEVKKSES